MTEYKYLGQTTHLNDTTKEDIYVRARAAWNCYEQNKKLPHITQNSVMDQCVLPTMTYGCQTWSLNRQLTNKLRTAQRATERKMFNLQLQDDNMLRDQESNQNNWHYSMHTETNMEMG